jgi:imidazole glycerol-phosphate synthase subunit HisF
MLKTRVIPCLLVLNGGLIKTIKFKDPRYIGDPINAIKIFNEKEVDELVLLDIGATTRGDGPSFSLLEEVASECFMPLAYGGGIRSVEDVTKIFNIGLEKAIINTRAYEDMVFIRSAVKRFGSQSIVASIDVKKSLFGKYQVVIKSGSKAIRTPLVEYAQLMAELGVGEIILNSVDNDGTFEGYNLNLIKMVSESVDVPVVALGGAGRLEDFALAIKDGASAVAAGSMFVYKGSNKGILINYPAIEKIEQVLRKGE